MTATNQAIEFRGKLTIVGFGSVAQGVLPLILRHIAIPPSRIGIVAADASGSQIASSLGVTNFCHVRLSHANFREILRPRLEAGDFLLNLSVDVSSIDLIELCREREALYLDTCIEPWAGGYTDATLSPTERTNYGLREKALAIGRRGADPGPTCVLTHGVNPGLISHFTKRALQRMAGHLEIATGTLSCRQEWAALARRLGVRAMHIAERDFQRATQAKARGEFINTWSIDGFVGEGSQPAELGWGTHEKTFPPCAKKHSYGSQAAIFLERPGVSVRVRSWTPLEGPYHGFLITHGESISLADYFTESKDDRILYRPTVHYAYHPCDDAVMSVMEYCAKSYQLQPTKRLLQDEITSGIDELGILVCGNEHGAYWYGSRLDIAEARRLAPFNNATTLQTAAGVLGGVIWAIENPARGVIEPEYMDHERVLAIAEPYLGTMCGVWSNWTPLSGRSGLFAEDLDQTDPWQFRNVMVI